MSPAVPLSERMQPGGDRTIRLLVRSLSPTCRSQLESVVERLDALEERGVIQGYDVDICGHKLPTGGRIAETSACIELREQLEKLEAWAEDAGQSLDPIFQRVEGVSEIDGEDHSGVVFPTVTLVEYVDTDVVFVAPSAGPDGVTSVSDRLDELRDAALDTATN